MALIDKLKNIANAIRSKTNKSEEMTLEQMASEVRGIDTLQGLDFSSIYDQEQSDEINQYYKDGIAYAEEIKTIVKSNTTIEHSTLDKGRLVFFPYVDLSHIRSISMPFFHAVYLDYISQHLNFSNTDCYRLLDSCHVKEVPPIDCSATKTLHLFAENAPCLRTIYLMNTSHISVFYGIFYTSTLLTNIYIDSIISATNFNNAFINCEKLQIFQAKYWKQSNISINMSPELSAESIHYIIQNAMNVSDGATARTLTLHATAKTNWQNSEYYAQDMAVLTQKGITIA